MNNHSTLSEKQLRSSFYVLGLILEHHPLTHAETAVVETAYESCGSTLGILPEAERGLTVRIDVETVMHAGAPLKTERAAMALEQAYTALTLRFNTPLPDDLASLVEDAVRALVTGRVLPGY